MFPLRRWRHNYRATESFESSEPDPTAVSSGIVTDPGVYLFWTLPDALRPAPSGIAPPNGLMLVEVSYPDDL